MRSSRVPRRTSTTLLVLLLLSSAALPGAGGSQRPAPAITPAALIRLFDGRSLANFETWLVDDHHADPSRVFTVVDRIDGAPAIRISGEVWGGLLTKATYRDYRLTVEYRWGGATWGARKTRARDSGILLHAQGRPGNTSRDFNGPWLRSIEFQIIEGGVGDIILVSGYSDTGELLEPALTVQCRTDRDGETVYDPEGERKVLSSGRVNWWGRSVDWEDRLGFRGPDDVESAGPAWTRLEAVARNGTLRYFVNGRLVNEATETSVTEGRIMIQSEGAEIYIRRVDLEPLR